MIDYWCWKIYTRFIFSVVSLGALRMKHKRIMYSGATAKHGNWVIVSSFMINLDQALVNPGGKVWCQRHASLGQAWAPLMCAGSVAKPGQREETSKETSKETNKTWQLNQVYKTIVKCILFIYSLYQCVFTVWWVGCVPRPILCKFSTDGRLQLCHIRV